MLDLKLSPKAIIDLEYIYEYTLSTWGFNQAEKYQDELYACMINISENPMLGSIYYFKSGNYRKMNINRHVIFYRQTKRDCLVVRILHERMDLHAVFS